jgi:pyruvate dehydrogenase E2 component (dihydrolipoamide acetyltransferase)
MSTEVVMPQMGESIAEGTIVRWIKKVGEQVDRDEPLFEISTDKVDAEIPSPAAGVVSEIRVKEGETVPVNSVVAVIGGAVQTTAAAPPSAPPQKAEPPKPSQHADETPAAVRADAPSKSTTAAVRGVEPATPSVPASRTDAPRQPSTTESAIRQRSSPLVRRIAREHNVDISQLHGTGIAGRVTKNDILAHLGQVGPAGQVGPVGQVTDATEPRVASGDSVEKMSPMRKRIAEHMVLSRRTSAHVHSVFEVNFSRVAQVREARKAEFERAGAKLTYLSFIVKAAIDALHAVPIVNASVDGDTIVLHGDVNIGIAVALDWGLIVPVIKHADEKNLLGLSRSIADLANRARTKQLKPDDVQGGTFTITNPGVFGALFGMPIINQPQVAILGVGNVEKRPVVIDDAIAIRQMAYLSLGYDHRIIDGAVADQFMAMVKRTLETWS